MSDSQNNRNRENEDIKLGICQFEAGAKKNTSKECLNKTKIQCQLMSIYLSHWPYEPGDVPSSPGVLQPHR